MREVDTSTAANNRLPLGAALVVFVAAALPLVLLGPAILSFRPSAGIDVFSGALWRTIVFSCGTAVATVALAVVGASILARLFSLRSAQFLGLLLIPLLLGDATTALGFKVILGGGTELGKLFETAPEFALPVVAFMRVWQFGTIFAYTIWLQFAGGPQEQRDYFAALRVGHGEWARQVALPATRYLILLFVWLAAVFAYAEYFKLKFVFRAAEGTRTELISHWLSRTYQELLLGNPYLARELLYGRSLGVAVIGAVVLGCLVAITAGLMPMAWRPARRESATKQMDGRSAARASRWLVGTCVVVIVLGPLAAPTIAWDLVAPALTAKTALAAGLALCPAVLGTGIAVIYAFFLRVIVVPRLRSAASLMLLLGLPFLVLLLPSLALFLGGFEWFRFFERTDVVVEVGLWVAGHTMILFPFLASFVFIVHLSVADEELTFLHAHQARLSDVFRDSFLRRFPRPYALTFLVAVSLVWNDGAWNRLFSDHIPSYVSALELSLSGKSGDLAVAAGYYLLAVALSFACYALWWRVLQHNFGESSR